MRRLALLGVALTLASAPAAAAEWRLASLSNDDTGRRIAVFIDQASIRRTGSSVRFWLMRVVERPVTASEFDKATSLRQASCDEMSSATLQTSYFINGRYQSDGGALPSQFYAPDSVMYGLIQTACGLEEYDSPPIDDPESVMRSVWAKTPR